MSEEGAHNRLLFTETSELSLAAFYKVRGLRLYKVKHIGLRRCLFTFADPDELAEKLSIEWVNSDLFRFDMEMRSLKKLIYRNSEG